MKYHAQALREEGVPEAWIKDRELMAFLDKCEAERIAAEAREEALAQSNRAVMPDLFGANERVWDWTPKSVRLPTQKPLPESIAAIENAAQANIDFSGRSRQRRTYTRESARNDFIWIGKENQARAGLLMHSLKEAIDSSPDSNTYRSVWMWIRLPDRTNPFAFAECCAVLNQDPDALRLHLNTLRRESLDHATWLRTEREFLEHELIECKLTARTLLDWEHVGELRDALRELDDARDIHTGTVSGKRERRQRMDHFRCQLQEHRRSLASDDPNDHVWILNAQQLRSMVKSLRNFEIIAEPSERDRITELLGEVNELLAPTH